MTRWTYEEVRQLYRRAEEAEKRAEEGEVELARANARIKTLHSKFRFPGNEEDHEPFDKGAADALAAAADVMVHRKLIDARSLVADARLDYGEPWSHEDALEILDGKRQPSATTSAARDAFDAIAKAVGCPEWDYPGQLVRDVEALATKAQKVERWLNQLTGASVEHAEGYEGPCLCSECHGLAAEDG